MNKKTQNLFFVGIGIIFIVFILLFIDSISGDKKDSDNVMPDEVSAFSKDTLNKLYTNKVKAYNDLDQEQEEEREKINNNANVDLGKIFSSDGNSEPVPETVEEKPEEKPEAKPINNPRPQVRKRVFETPVQKEQSVTSNTNQVVAKNEPDNGFGIYSVKKKKVEETEPEQKATQSYFYPAYFEEDTKIKNNSPVVMILRANAILEGISFNKNATLYGYASDAGTYFDITISSIKNTDGKSYHLNNLVVYNEKYGRGISHEGKLDSSVKESTDETVNDIGDNVVTGSATEQIGVNVVKRAASRTLQNLTKNREREISIMHGYKIFVKSE